MKLHRWNYLYLHLLITMFIIMAVSFIPEHFHEFFGDWKCDGMQGHWEYKNGHDIWTVDRGNCGYGHEHAAGWHWGFRHIVLNVFGVIFALVNIIRIASEWERRSK